MDKLKKAGRKALIGVQKFVKVVKKMVEVAGVVIKVLKAFSEFKENQAAYA